MLRLLSFPMISVDNFCNHNLFKEEKLYISLLKGTQALYTMLIYTNCLDLSVIFDLVFVYILHTGSNGPMPALPHQSVLLLHKRVLDIGHRAQISV